MSYSSTNPPVRVTHGGLTTGTKSLWIYTSADAHATVEASQYFTNGHELGMKVGDALLSICTTGYLATLHAVSAVTKTNAGTPSETGTATVSAAVLA